MTLKLGLLIEKKIEFFIYLIVRSCNTVDQSKTTMIFTIKWCIEKRRKP
jgi:hypothetical protein